MSQNEEICISHQNKEGAKLSAVFLPDQGMNFISYKKDGLEVIDPSTRGIFEERFAGLGAMIGPHFHHRKVIPPVKNEALFPHIERVRLKGTKEPFSHGIGRYARWKVESKSPSKLKCTLSGKDLWNGQTLAMLEGQDFEMSYEAEMGEKGLQITLDVTSEKGSVVGLHTYYALDGKGVVLAQVQKEYSVKGEWKPLPKEWTLGADQTLRYPLEEEIDFGFLPFPDPLGGTIYLKTPTHGVKVSYTCDHENSWQLFHPAKASYVCIEPLSAKNPRAPEMKESHLKILIEIVP